MENIDKLNELIEYIELNLDKKIDDKKMSQILGVNSYTLYRIFLFITGISLTEYIRNRRLSKSALDIIDSNKKIIDIAYSYGYTSPDGFSRAFYKFHGIKPSELKHNTNYIKNYPPYHFNTTNKNIELNYIIKEIDSFELYSTYFECTADCIKSLASDFWKQKRNDANLKKLLDKNISYGIINYSKNFAKTQKVQYHIASQSYFSNSQIFKIEKSKWAIFELKNFENEAYEGTYFDDFSHYVYSNWIPYSNYNIRALPELEVYYPNGKTEFWLPIE